ncbi:hypothetical protein GDO78_018229 [Eleutherodactylus coqui]|uniref:Uncharacterized protein n=1 Tax=Eleutherodactylus coqui TaxID=57060 RepID=A0A8J6B0X1_ELECQ|nr:hypothetical protein GDO78_018229 [Eleutherodactylus coqui]
MTCIAPCAAGRALRWWKCRPSLNQVLRCSYTQSCTLNAEIKNFVGKHCRDPIMHCGGSQRPLGGITGHDRAGLSDLCRGLCAAAA